MSERVELVQAAKGDRRYAISDKVVDLRIRSNRICHGLPPTEDERVGERLSRGRGSAGGWVVMSSLPRTNTSLAAHGSQTVDDSVVSQRTTSVGSYLEVRKSLPANRLSPTCEPGGRNWVRTSHPGHRGRDKGNPAVRPELQRPARSSTAWLSPGDNACDSGGDGAREDPADGVIAQNLGALAPR